MQLAISFAGILLMMGVAGLLTWYKANNAMHSDAATVESTNSEKEIAALKADKSVPEAEKREGLAQLEAALKNARPVQFKENIALVLKYFDKLAPLMQEQQTPCCARSVSCNLLCKNSMAHSLMSRKSASIGSRRCRDDFLSRDKESRCQRSTLSSTISARNLPCSAVMRPTVMGRRKRRGPALPGLKKSVPFFVSILGWCE
jgi:hypothetical protein